MQLSVSGKHIDVGEALTSHVRAALAGTVERHFGQAIEGRAVFARERHHFRADIVVHPVALLTLAEAVTRMDLADLPVLLFRNRSHGGYGVLHRRPDGSIGWIDAGSLPRD
jgi:hypothetical protein